MSNITGLNTVSEPVRNLRKIREIFPQTIIAGGYYRDIYHNIPFSDVDIFIGTEQFTIPLADGSPLYKYSDFYTVEFWASIFNIDDTTNTHSFYCCDYIDDVTSNSEYYEDENIDAVFELLHNQIKYNLILLPDIEPIKFITDQFDFGICKIYGDGTKVTLTNEFMHDSRYKTLTLTDNKLSFETFCRSMRKHLKKLRKKFPGYTVSIPNIHQSHLRKSKITL